MKRPSRRLNPVGASEDRRVVHIAIDHDALDIRVYHKEALTLSNGGYDVHIIAARSPDVDTAGVRIHVLDSGLTKDMSSGRLVGRIRRLIATLRLARTLRAKVYHLHEPLLIPVGLLLKICGAAVIYDAHEDYEHVASRFSARGWTSAWARLRMYRILGWLARRHFDAVVAATPAIQGRFGGTRTVLVRNYPLLNELRGHSDSPYATRPRAIVYVGGISRARGIVEMLDAIQHLGSVTGVRMNLAGAFMPQSMEQQAASHPGWGLVDYAGWLNREGVGRLLASSRIGLLVLHPDPNHVESLPVKLFEYMAVGLPVIASDFPLWREIIDGAKCGLLVDPLDSRAIARAILFLLDHPLEALEMGRRGQAAVEETFNWNGEGRNLLRLYRELAP